MSPTGLTGAAGDGRVMLQWRAVSTATSYEVDRAPARGGPYSAISTTSAGAYTDTKVTNGTDYYYEVVAINSAGRSGASGPVLVIPVAAGAPPVTPTNLRASAQAGAVNLTWTASANVVSYKIKRWPLTPPLFASAAKLPVSVNDLSLANATIITPAASAIVTQGTTLQYTDTSVTAGSDYLYTIVAVNAAGTSPNTVQSCGSAAAAGAVLSTIRPRVSMAAHGTNLNLPQGATPTAAQIGASVPGVLLQLPRQDWAFSATCLDVFPVSASETVSGFR